MDRSPGFWRKAWLATVLICTCTAAPLPSARAASVNHPVFDPRPWLDDLEQARHAFRTKYANLEWLEGERQVKLDPLFDDLKDRMARAHSPDDARAVFDRLVQTTGDGHVEIDWPQPPASSPGIEVHAAPVDPCEAMGFDAHQNSAGTAKTLPSYVALVNDTANPFSAGLATLGSTRVGVIRIGVFQAQGFPQLCRTATRVLGLSAVPSCDERCQNKIVDWIYPRLTAALEERVRELKRKGATVLLVDITGNGGGSEWVEAAARMFSAKLLVSERRGMVRGEHWAGQWKDLAEQLRGFARSATGADRTRLLHWAAEAQLKLHEAQSPCQPNAPCSRIADAGFSTGLVASARSGSFAGKEWGHLVFSPSLFPYHDGVWRGPLIVLVDDNTWSAAEEFAALLQDNKAAVVLGRRTGGAGCGHTNGGDPVTLSYSRAVLQLPDCVRFRADGSNEVRGILPDISIPIRDSDGALFRARLLARYLPEAILKARRLGNR